MKSWLLALRPKTLTAAVVPILVTTALVWRLGVAVNWMIFALALTASLAIQIATNLINDYVDFDKGADTAERIGPVRVTQSGAIHRRHVKAAAFAFLALALLAGVPLVVSGGWPILAVGLISLALAYGYTGGPLPLAYVGLGDIFVILFFGLIAVGAFFYLQTHTYTWDSLVLGLQIGFLATVLIAINNLRDVYQDAKAAKRTLAVRFGVAFAQREILALILMPFALQLYWAFRFGWLCAILPLVWLPFGLRIARQILKHEPSPIFNQFLAQAAALHGGFAAVFSLILILR